MLHCLDRQPGWRVVLLGVLLGLGLGGPALWSLRAPAWLLLWAGVGLALWRLAASAEPLFEEANPRRPDPRPTPVQDEPLRMIELPGGQLVMGSPDSDDMAMDREKPQHRVAVSGFRLAVTPVTAGLYNEVMQRDPVSPEEADLPVVNVNWDDAITFCNRLSEREGYRRCYRRRFRRWVCHWRADGYRLPTEAEWEYACRAGTTTRYAFGDDPAQLEHYAWFAGNAPMQAQAVAQKRPNRWGLYDMHGNVWEWCWDWFGEYKPGDVVNPTGPRVGSRRVVRGGSFFYPPEDLRSALRDGDLPVSRDKDLGFRCVRVPPALRR